MPAIPASAGPYRDLLENSDYRLLLVSSLGSSLGDWVGLFALQVLALRLADPGSRVALFGLGAVMLARLLPSMLFGPVAGILADRYDRKRLLVGADVTRGVLFVAIAFSRQLWLLLTLVLLVECCSLLYLTAKNAVLPAILEESELAQGNQLNQLATYGPLPFGAAVDGLLTWMGARLGVDDPTTVALVGTAAVFISAGLVLRGLHGHAHGAPRARGKDAGDRRSGGLAAEVREGVAAVSDRPVIRSLLLGLLGVFFGAGAFVALGPELVRAELGRTEADWYGLMTTVGFGLLAGIVGAPVLLGRWGAIRTAALALVGASAAALASAALPGFRLVQASGSALGAFAGAAFVAGFTVLHERTSSASRARVFAAVYTATRVAMFAALGVGPFVAGALGTPSLTVGERTFAVSGSRAVMLAGAAIALASAAAAAVPMWREAAGSRR